MALAQPPVECKVYTPSVLAKAMVNALGVEPGNAWLEPSHGKGAFLQALAELGVHSSLVTAIDLDSRSAVADKLAMVLRGVDFLRWAALTQCRFDRIIGNPPFLAIRSLPPSLHRAAESVLDLNETPIGRRANTWYAFLLSSLRLLSPGGNLAFVLPAACEYADYCRPLRASITSLFERVDLIRSRKPLFEDVQDGAAVLICSNRGGTARSFRRHEVDNLDGVVARLQELISTSARRCPARVIHPGELVALGEVVQFRLGGVTGDADYFLLSESERVSHKLPVESLVPVVSKARHVASPHILRSDWERLKKSGARVWLFNPPNRALRRRSVQRYLKLPPEDGGCLRERYKVSIRDPWYQTPMPGAPHAFVSGMTESGPWFCMNRMRTLNATNTLYVVSFREKLSLGARYSWALACMTTPAVRQVRRAARRYADGLRKIEPGQLSSILVPRPRRIENSEDLYNLAFEKMLAGDESAACKIADNAILRK
jgi:adenine-specific DNA-methyltransferase